MSYILAIVIFVILFFIGLNFVSSRNQIPYIKCSVFGGAFLLLSHVLIVFVITNPSEVTMYQGVVQDKRIDVTTRTETYQCGESTCTRQIQEEHYMVVGRYAQNQTCEKEISSYSDWKAIQIGDDYVCDISERNYTLLDKSQYETSNTILNQYKQYNETNGFFSNMNKNNTVLPNRSIIKQFDNIKYYFIHNFAKQSNANEIEPLQSIVKQFLFQKHYSVDVILTNQDSNFIYALNHEFKGANVGQVLLVYGINETNDIQWSKMLTFANGDENHKMIADHDTKYVINTNKTFKLKNELLNDLQFIDKHYVKVNNDKYKYLKENKANVISNGVFVFIVLAQIIMIVILTKRY